MADQPPAGKGGKKILGMPHQTGMFVVVAAIAAGGLLLVLWLKNRNAAGQQQPAAAASGDGSGGLATGGGQSDFMEIIKSTGGHQPQPWPVDKGHKHGGGGGEHRGRHDAGTLGGSAHNPKG